MDNLKRIETKLPKDLYLWVSMEALKRGISRAKFIEICIRYVKARMNTNVNPNDKIIAEL